MLTPIRNLPSPADVTPIISVRDFYLALRGSWKRDKVIGAGFKERCLDLLQCYLQEMAKAYSADALKRSRGYAR